MSDPTFYSVKEVLAQIDARLTDRLDRIEQKLDRKASDHDLTVLSNRVIALASNALTEADANTLRKVDLQRLADQVRDLDEKALTVDNVKETIALVLRESEARGWTNRERFMGFILFGVTLASFVLNILQSS